MLKDKCRERIMKMEWSSQAIADLLNAVASEAAATGSPASTLVIPCYEAGDLVAGEYAPEVHIVCRKVEG